MSEQIVSRDQRISNWEALERISKTLSIFAIPVVLGFGGWIIQQRLQNQTVSRDYVQLAVSILKEPKDSKIDPEMRDWAVQLLNENSPTKFNQRVVDQLKAGTTQLPETYNVTQPVTSEVTASGNPKQEAADWELKGFDSLVHKDAEAALQAFTNASKLYPSYHNVGEIKNLIQKNLPALTSAPKEGKSEAWSSVYQTITSKYSWGMPADIKAQLAALI
jgi:hypothetical protein